MDKKALDTYVDSKTLAVILNYTEKHEQFKKLGVAMFANLSYEIKSIDLEGKTVTLEVKNKELGAAATEFTQSLLRTYSTMQLLERLSNDEWLDNNLSSLTAKIDEASMKEEPAEITIKIEQKKENLVLVFDENAENEISGGVLGAINSITTAK